MISQSAQDYLKAIYKLLNGPQAVESVNTSMVAEKMDVAAASATNMFKKLAEMKLVDHIPYQGVVLTRTGEEIALEVIRHHRLVELYLSEILGYDLDKVDAEAERLEHVISEEFEDKIDQALGFPQVDPHGAPIPGKDGSIAQRDYFPLSEVETGQTVRVRRVSDHSAEMLRYMGSLGLVPDARVEVRGRAPFNGPLDIAVNGGGECALGIEVANQIYVSTEEGFA